MINNFNHDDNNFLLSHEACRVKNAEIQTHFESFLGTKIVEEDKKVLLMLRDKKFLGTNPPPFHSWINTNNKVSILFKEPSNEEHDFTHVFIQVFFLPINSEKYKINSIETDNPYVKQFLSNINRNDIL